MKLFELLKEPVAWMLGSFLGKVLTDNLPSYRMKYFVKRWKKRIPIIKYHLFRIGVITLLMLSVSGIIKLKPKTSTGLLISLCFIILSDTMSKTTRDKALQIKSEN